MSLGFFLISVLAISGIGYFKEGQSGSVKDNTTLREGMRGLSAAAPRLPSRRVVLFFTSALAFFEVPYTPLRLFSRSLESATGRSQTRTRYFSYCVLVVLRFPNDTRVSGID